MIEPVTLEQVETLVIRLPPKDQLKLLAHISERLSDTLLTAEPATESDHEQRVRDERLRLAKALCDEVGETLLMTPKGASMQQKRVSIGCETRGLTQLCRSDA